MLVKFKMNKRIKSQSLNVSGKKKEYKDPSIIDEPKTRSGKIQLMQRYNLLLMKKNKNSEVASTENNTEVTNNEDVSEDTTQPTSNEEEQNLKL